MLVVLVGLLFIFDGVHSARILGVFPGPIPSHYFLSNSLMKGLAEKGHDVTMISPFVDKIPPKNGSYTNIVLTGFAEEHERLVKGINVFEMEKEGMFAILPILAKIINMCEQTFNHTDVQKLIHSGDKFDVVIVELLMNDAHNILASHFNAPLVLFSTVGVNTWINQLVGNPQPLAYVPDAFLGFSGKMSFFQRLLNTVGYVAEQGMNYLYMFPQQNKLVKKYFPNGPSLYDVIYNASILLVNSHPSIDQPVPRVPSMIDVGGLHVKPPKPLPKDLQELLDGAEEGVVYFSLGSYLKSTFLPKEKRQIFVKVFSKLKLTVLWKWEEDSLPGQPANVHLAKWLPQQDILAHPNVKLFITHGGFLSTTETIYNGVPALAIPIMGDQNLNAQQIVNQGIGLSMSFQEITEEALTDKINELLTNPEYTKNAKSKSKVFHDRLVSPLDTAIYWVEYVIQHGGAPHLRVGGLDLPWYQYFLLDVIGVVSVVTLVALLILYQSIKKIFSVCRKQRKQKLN
ncbi:unnamed protein product [Tenebrio molitor]|nr:unnamed protein product [Tenebrio molitor]